MLKENSVAAIQLMRPAGVPSRKELTPPRSPLRDNLIKDNVARQEPTSQPKTLESRPAGVASGGRDKCQTPERANLKRVAPVETEKPQDHTSQNNQMMASMEDRRKQIERCQNRIAQLAYRSALEEQERVIVQSKRKAKQEADLDLR
jgi:hypothetical protein